jgi:hypothetical protein
MYRPPAKEEDGLFSILCGRCDRIVLLPGSINDDTGGIGVSRTSDGVGQLSEETDKTMFIEHRVYKSCCAVTAPTNGIDLHESITSYTEPLSYPHHQGTSYEHYRARGAT